MTKPERKRRGISLLFGLVALVASQTCLAVQIAQTGVGQVLLAPMYMAINGYSATKITVSNTSTEDAVKAMLVVRSRKEGELLKGVVIYLSPGDTFTGVVRRSASGGTEFWSDDDSVLGVLYADGTAKFASQIAGGVTFPISTPKAFDDTSTQGAIEVIGAYAVRGTIGTPSGNVTIGRAMSKFDLLKIFSSNRDKLTPATDTPNQISSVTPSMLLLRGRIEIRKSDSSDRMVYDMTALEASPASAGKLSSKVINNPQFDVSVMQTPNLGEKFGTSISPDGDNIVDIETALATQTRDGFFTNSSSLYGEQTNILVSFPTKYRHKDKDVCGNGATVSGYSAPFNTSGVVQYLLTSVDSQGNWIGNSSAPAICLQSPCPTQASPAIYFTNSMNYIYGGLDQVWQYINGQIQINFVEIRGCPYPGVPALAMTHNYLGTGTGFNGSLMTYLNGSTSGPAIQDRIFNWAEKKFPSMLYPPTKTTATVDSGYRTYSGSGITLIEKGGRIKITTPDQPGMLQDVGSAEDYFRQARADGF